MAVVRAIFVVLGVILAWFGYALGLGLQTIIVAVIPVPLGFLKRNMAGRYKETGNFVFYPHQDLVVVGPFVMVSWAITFLNLWNVYGWNKLFVPAQVLGIIWMSTLLVTILMLGVRVNRVGVLVLFSLTLAASALPYLLREAGQDVTFIERAQQAVLDMPLKIDWGMPLFSAVFLGLGLAVMYGWNRLDGRWLIGETGDVLTQVKFQAGGTIHPKDATQIELDYSCLLRRYLLFGMGDIILTSPGRVTRIHNVFFAAKVVLMLRRRWGVVDARMVREEPPRRGRAAAPVAETASATAGS